MKKDVAEWLVYISIFTLAYFKPQLDSWRKKRKVSLTRSVNAIEQIDKLCYYLLGVLNAKRISVWQFGNGDTSFMGFSFKYASMVGEAVKTKEQKYLRNESQKVPIYDYAPILDRINRKEGIYKYYASDFSGNLHNILVGMDIFCAVDIKLNQSRIEDGILSISFDADKQLSVYEREQIEQTTYEIHEILKRNK